MSPAILRYVIVLSAAVHLALAKDPLDDFCRRWGHQTTVIDRKLYIDGGQVTWNPMSQNPLNYTNTWLLYQDLDILNQGMPQLEANLSKNSTIPDLSGGVLWGDDINKVFYLYGGEYTDGASPEDFQPWAYDVLLNQWNQTSSDAASGIQRVSFGAGATVNETGVGYFLGGYLNNNTVPGWAGPPLATSNLISYDMVGDVWTNATGPDDTGRAEGVMVYLPASDQGLLIYFGGILDPFKNGTVVGSAMSTIYIYDIASTKWYTQTASGEIPDMRRKFCAGATWAQDQSSYNIYLYGGQGITNTTGFDDVYILSLPSFTWIKWYPTTPGAGNPHGILSCNVIDNSQMLIIGGWFADNDECDAPTIWGTHNLNLGEDGAQNAMWDLFEPNITEYRVPPEIISAVGGSPTGGATLRAPSTWDNRDLSVYFTRIPSYSTRVATRAIPTSTSAHSSSSGSNGSSSSHAGAIAGGVVGGVGGLILIILLVLYCLHRRKKAKKNTRPPSELPANPPAELASSPSYREPKSGSVDTNGVTPIHTYNSNQSSSPPGMSPTGSGVPFTGTPTSPYSTMQSGQYPPGYGQQPPGQYSPSAVSPQWPTYPPGAAPYDPSQHSLHQEHFQPPPLPKTGASGLAVPGGNGNSGGAPVPTPSDYSRETDSTSNTPAHFYPQPLNVAQQRHTSGGSIQNSQEMPLVGRISESVGSLKSPKPRGGRFREEG